MPQTSEKDLLTDINPDGRCIDPVPLLSNQGRAQRCLGTDNCGGEMCVRPHDSAELLRIVVEPVKGFERSKADSGLEAETILWSGSRGEVWEQGLFGYE